MKTVKNEKLIERNKKIGTWVSVGALGVLGVGMYLSFTRLDLFAYSMGCLILGFIMTQVGMYMGNRWGRSPRPDEKLDSGLKGIHTEANIYHYASPVSHLVVSPSGVFVLLPYHQSGKISYAKNRWKLSGGGFMQAYMKIFGQENIGRPDIEAESEVQTLRKFFAKNMEEHEIPEIKPILVFTADEIILDVDDSPILAVKIKQLRDHIRQSGKNRALTSSQLEKVKKILE